MTENTKPASAKERPILFSGPMVRALLEGSKTQTRRVVKYPTQEGKSGWHPNKTGWQFLPGGSERPVCPYGRPGDRLWVRETFIQGWPSVDGNHDQFYEDGSEKPVHTWYRATSPDIGWTDDDGFATGKTPWKPSIHMPRWASRITLEIVSVRVERLQDISEADALAEGVCAQGGGLYELHYFDLAGRPALGSTQSPRLAYRGIWESINGAGSWDANPWVWVVEFKRVEGGAA